MPGPKYVKDFEFPSSAGFTGSSRAEVREVRFMARGGKARATPAQRAKIGKVMGEFGRGALHSGSKQGPVVTNPKQAQAIAMSEAGMSRPNLKERMRRPGGMKKGGVGRPRQGALSSSRANGIARAEMNSRRYMDSMPLPSTGLRGQRIPVHRGEPMIGRRGGPGRG